MKRLFYFLSLSVFVLFAAASCKSSKNEPTVGSNRGTSIRINPDTLMMRAGDEQRVQLISTAAWSATTSTSWVSVSPAAGQGDAFITVTIDNGVQDTAQVIFSNGEGTATLTVVRSTDGALFGEFTIGYKKQIIFSQGNLQYQASTNTWRFAENQWDMAGYANSNISDTYEGWMDLFGWGTGKNPTLKSNKNDDYDTYAEWGDNAISNGGNVAKKWRRSRMMNGHTLLTSAPMPPPFADKRRSIMCMAISSYLTNGRNRMVCRLRLLPTLGVLMSIMPPIGRKWKRQVLSFCRQPGIAIRITRGMREMPAIIGHPQWRKIRLVKCVSVGIKDRLCSIALITITATVCGL